MLGLWLLVLLDFLSCDFRIRSLVHLVVRCARIQFNIHTTLFVDVWQGSRCEQTRSKWMRNGLVSRAICTFFFFHSLSLSLSISLSFRYYYYCTLTVWLWLLLLFVGALPKAAAISLWQKDKIREDEGATAQENKKNQQIIMNVYFVQFLFSTRSAIIFITCKHIKRQMCTQAPVMCTSCSLQFLFTLQLYREIFFGVWVYVRFIACFLGWLECIFEFYFFSLLCFFPFFVRESFGCFLCVS